MSRERTPSSVEELQMRATHLECRGREENECTAGLPIPENPEITGHTRHMIRMWATEIKLLISKCAMCTNGSELKLLIATDPGRNARDFHWKSKNVGFSMSGGKSDCTTERAVAQNP